MQFVRGLDGQLYQIHNPYATGSYGGQQPSLVQPWQHRSVRFQHPSFAQPSLVRHPQSSSARPTHSASASASAHVSVNVNGHNNKVFIQQGQQNPPGTHAVPHGPIGLGGVSYATHGALSRTGR
jgi:hypothetical protein